MRDGCAWTGRIDLVEAGRFLRLNRVVVLAIVLSPLLLLNGCAGVVSQTTQAIKALFHLNTSSINFGNVTVGKQATQTVTVSNTGTVAMNITQATVSNSQFGLSGLTLPMPLAVGQSGNFTVTASPTSAGSVTGTLTVSGDGGSTPAVVPLSATAVSNSQPQLSVAPTSAAFGSVTVGSSSSQTIQLTNSGTGTLTITQLSVTGSGFSSSALSLPISLGANQSSTFNLQFAPTSAGTVSGSVTIVSNAPNSPATIPLSGTGVAATFTLSFSSTTLTFGNVNTGSSATQSVTVTNTGNANVQISQISESGAGFSLTGAGTPVTLTPGQSLTFNVVFSPTAAGTDSGTVTVTSNASGSPATITLSGSGVTPTTHTVSLSWTASTSTVSGYNVYRSTVSGTGYSKINSGLVAAVSYVDSNVQNGTTYYYVATAVDASGTESVYSNQATAVIP